MDIHVELEIPVNIVTVKMIAQVIRRSIEEKTAERRFMLALVVIAS